MQIVYLGFAGSNQLEAEAGAQFVRLERFGKLISGCHLAIEACGFRSGNRLYDARLDLITRGNDLIPVEHCTDEDPRVALRAAFDAAVRWLEQPSADGGLADTLNRPARPVSRDASSDRLASLTQRGETNMYEHILVALDCSESSKRALGEAIRMAQLAHGKVTAVYVVDSSTTFAYAGEFDPLALTRALRIDGERVLEEARKLMAGQGVAGTAQVVETDGLSEDVASCLRREAQRVGADLVVLGTHGRRGVRRMVIGSVAERFVRFSTCPVLLVREVQPAL
ncbi:universal stress protein [Paraburkholderia sp. BL10I2N1]|uniref:universal stress protein n=1 Tax=Paraburkholderia sp. BL10I2N1 TaxID=1938796 RepID=UPI0032600D7B